MGDNQTVDFWLLITALVLAGVGLVMVYSSSMYLSMDRIGDGMYYFKKQALHLVIGLVIMMFLLIVGTTLNILNITKSQLLQLLMLGNIATVR